MALSMRKLHEKNDLDGFMGLSMRKQLGKSKIRWFDGTIKGNIYLKLFFDKPLGFYGSLNTPDTRRVKWLVKAPCGDKSTSNGLEQP